MKKLTLVVLCATAVALSPSSASADLLLQYAFDEASGNALDTGAAPATDGSLEGGAVRSSDTPGGFGSSIDLRDDATSYAHVLEGDASDLDGLSAITLTTWLKLEAYAGGSERLLAKQAAGSFGGFNWSIHDPVDGTVSAGDFKMGLFLGDAVSGDFSFQFSTADAGADNEWTFLAATYDSALATDNTRYYVGGVNTPVTQLGDPVTINQLTIDGGTALFGVGYTDAAPGSDESADSWMDDVRVYDTALDLASLEAARVSNVIPEPSTLALVGLAAAGLACVRRRR